MVWLLSGRLKRLGGDFAVVAGGGLGDEQRTDSGGTAGDIQKDNSEEPVVDWICLSGSDYWLLLGLLLDIGVVGCGWVGCSLIGF